MENPSAERSQLSPWKWLTPLVVLAILGGWLLFTPEGLLGKADGVGYAVCHRIDVRSFHLGIRQLPLCARCSGMYLGVLAGIGLQSVYGKRAGFPSRVWLAFYAFLAMAFAVDGANSYITFFSNAPHLYEPGNLLRLITGTGMGLAVAAFILPAFHQTLWKDYEGSQAFSHWQQAVLLLGMAAIIDAAVLSENLLLLYPLALISAAGVVILLSMVYGMVWVMLTKKENRYRSLTEAWLPLTAGFGTAVLQIFLIDVVRLAFTGTWSGFSL